MGEVFQRLEHERDRQTDAIERIIKPCTFASDNEHYRPAEYNTSHLEAYSIIAAWSTEPWS